MPLDSHASVIEKGVLRIVRRSSRSKSCPPTNATSSPCWTNLNAASSSCAIRLGKSGTSPCLLSASTRTPTKRKWSAPYQHRAGTGPGRKKKQAGVPPGDGEPGLLPSSFPSPPSLPPNPPQAGGSDASQGSGEEPDRRSPRAKGENPRAVGKAAETRALAEETQAIRDKRRALWSDRLMQYRAGGKWQTTWGAEPWSGNLGCLVPLDMRDEFGSARLEVEQPGFLKSAARPAPDDEAALAARYEELTERRTA